jgi:phage protein D
MSYARSGYITEVNATLDDVALQGILAVTLTSTNSYSADCYTIVIHVGNSPLNNLEYWRVCTGGYIELSLAIQPGTAMPLTISGYIDQIIIDQVGSTVSIEGRDLSALMIDSFQQQDFVNQSASEIVASVATRHGLGASVTPTTGFVGRFYGDGYTRVSLGQFSKIQSDWDLVAQLARENQFDAYVLLSTLYFAPQNVSMAPAATLSFQNTTALRIDRRLAASIQNNIRIQSWNSQSMASYIKGPAVVQVGTFLTAPAGVASPYLFSAPNLIQSQADADAVRYQSEVSRLQTVLEVEMPFNPSVRARSLIQITGISPSINGNYLVDFVETNYRASSGTTQRVSAIPASNLD